MRIGLDKIIENAIKQVEAELPERARFASAVLRNATTEVFRGTRTGRVYRTPRGGRYTASAPGEPPAIRTGALRESWRPVVSGNNPAIESNVRYAGYLEHGTRKMARRPYEEKTVELAMPHIQRIYSKPYKIRL